MSAFEDQSFEMADNIAMRGRFYRGGDKTLAICIPGLTRNASDFEDIAPQIASTGRDVLTVSLRGRANSDYDPTYLNYFPTTYRDDIIAVLDQVGVKEAVFVGTSLGGIVTMLTNEKAPKLVKAAIINDVGPELASEGIARIAGYVGGDKEPAKDLEEAASRIKAINEVAFPDADEDFWLTFAKRTFKQIDNGAWVLDYDPNIALAMAEAGPAPDLWSAFASLKSKPTLLIHGAISDLLTTPIVEKMREVHPSFDYAAVPRIGHAPTLSEPVAWDAIEALLSKVE